MAIELLHPSDTVIVNSLATDANLVLTPKGTGSVVVSGQLVATGQIYQENISVIGLGLILG